MLELWCNLDRQPACVIVSVLPTQTIYHLKEKIYEEHSYTLANRCDPGQLSLMKVRYTMICVNIDIMNDPYLLCLQVDVPHSTVRGQIAEGKYRPVNGTFLNDVDKIKDVWPEQPNNRHLHIFAIPPAEMGSPTLVQGECFIRLFTSVEDI